MILLNPKLLALLGLLAAVIVFTAPKSAPKLVAARAVQDGSENATRRLNAKAGELERLKARGYGQQERAGAISFVETTTRPPETLTPLDAPAPDALTVEDLLRAMDQALLAVPGSVPNLPFMSALAHTMLKQDPRSITFAPVAPGALGEFDFARAEGPQIRLSPQLAELHAQGVPTRLLTPVLIHELDHMLAYVQGRGRFNGDRRHAVEHRAFTSQSLFLFGLGLHKNPDGDAVEALNYDPKAKAYLDDLKRIRQGLFSGDLKRIVDDRYGPDEKLR